MSNSALVAAALKATDPDLASQLDASNTWLTQLNTQGARVTLFREYERGDHRASITDQMRRMLRLPDQDDTGMTDLNDNYMELVVGKMASRAKISEISVTSTSNKNLNTPSDTTAPTSEGTSDNDAASQWLASLLEKNNFDALQAITFRSAMRDGESFIMIDPRTGQWTAEETYDGHEGIVAVMGDSGRTPIWAAKLWAESMAGEGGQDVSVVKIVVYQPEAVTRWVGEPGGQEVKEDPAYQEEKVVADTKVVESTNQKRWPTGVLPMVQFVNKYSVSAPNGESELRSVIPLQDILNRTIHSMVMASEFSAFQIKWSIGMDIDASGIVPGAVINLTLKDSSGKVATELNEATIEFLKTVRVGQFDATDLSQYINQIDRIVKEISQNSQTPIYGVTTAGALSGDALKQLEIGLIGKVERFQVQNTDAIRTLIKLASTVQNSFIDTGKAPTIESVSITWKPAELLDTAAQITALVQMRRDAPNLWPDDFYRRKIGALMGMSAKEVKDETAQQQAETDNSLGSITGGDSATELPVV